MPPIEPITSDSCLSGELAQSDMTRSMSIEEKPGSWAITALEAPPLAPEAVLDVSEVPPAAEVEPVASALEPASAAVELDVPVVSAVLEPVVLEPVVLEPASAAVEPVVSVVVEPVVEPVVPVDPVDPLAPMSALIEPEPAWKPLT
jgi:hypothetical protein